jgi:hypothetical protein
MLARMFGHVFGQRVGEVPCVGQQDLRHPGELRAASAVPLALERATSTWTSPPHWVAAVTAFSVAALID